MSPVSSEVAPPADSRQTRLSKVPQLNTSKSLQAIAGRRAPGAQLDRREEAVTHRALPYPTLLRRIQ